jgi:hypothetical protein
MPRRSRPTQSQSADNLLVHVAQNTHTQRRQRQQKEEEEHGLNSCSTYDSVGTLDSYFLDPMFMGMKEINQEVQQDQYSEIYSAASHNSDDSVSVDASDVSSERSFQLFVPEIRVNEEEQALESNNQESKANLNFSKKVELL